MLEWILHLLSQGIKLILESHFRLARNQLDIGHAAITKVGLCLIIGVFVLLEELSELLIIFQLLFFHWHNHLNVLFEILQMVHQDSLLFNKFSDVGVVFSDSALRELVIAYLDFILIVSKYEVSRCSLQGLE